MREVAWIIFDEVHYMRDRERGVVWEESIVMAPKNSRFVFLSATVPNAKEFADWVAKVVLDILMSFSPFIQSQNDFLLFRGINFKSLLLIHLSSSYVNRTWVNIFIWEGQD